MRQRALLMIAIALLACRADAGPNEAVVLAVHAAQEGFQTQGDPCGNIIFPDNCEDLVPSTIPDSVGEEWFAAVVVAPLGIEASFWTVTFGIGDYDPFACYIDQKGPCDGSLGPLEIPSKGWPGPNTGTSISWAPNELHGNIVPVYYFATYVYAPGTIPFGDFYPGEPAGIYSAGDPSEFDPFVGYGTVGCGGASGENVCPPGACCRPDGVCVLLSQSECEAAGWTFFEGRCDPSPCPEGACCFDTFCIMLTHTECMNQEGFWVGGSCWQPDNPCLTTGVAVEETSWGRIKAMYRE